MIAPTARYVVTIVVAAVLYYWLLTYAIAYAFVVVPGRETLLLAIDSRSVATHLWLQLAHTLAVLVAATPVAALIQFTSRPRTIVVALAVGTMVALAALAPTFLSESTRTLVVAGGHLGVMLVDHMKIALMVPALVWLSKLLPSNKSAERTRAA